MELFLNILWVLIALGALALWRLDWKHQERHARPKPLQEWTAFVCALVFVFFAVSLSDDLHAAEILSDDCLRGRHHSLASESGHHARRSTIPNYVSHAFALPRAAFFAPAQHFAPTVPVVIHTAAVGEFHFIPARSPPALPS